MIDLVATATTKNPKSVDSETDDCLVLPRGATPKTVYVKPVAQVAGFALEAAAPVWHTKGVSWEFSADETEYGLFITFVLLPGIVELELSDLVGAPPFWFSEKWVPLLGAHANELCCAPVVAKATTTYSFIVKLASGVRHDPKIVVTPFPGDGDGDVRARQA
jgi:hypothetical protein